MRPNAPFLLRIGVAAILLVFAAQSALAQLNENCTVSVLNRTVQVKPDGSWVLPNVPANFGQVRARATCVQDGVTTSGESDFFALSADGIVNLPEVVLGAATPIPVSLRIMSELVAFTTAGQTSQLAVTASFPDLSTSDVSAASTGTNYTSSNPATATVSEDGLVTAVTSGTVVVSATNKGVLGLIQIQVVLTGDSDGDGILDDVELANGLNPNNPVDALEDFDGDGLTNKEELVDFGTDMRNADTDDDGIEDGEEVKPGDDGFITSPLLVDSDGDGIRDGLEISTGSDPTDPTSFNLAQALASVEVTPLSFILTFNTIVGEASQQLSVTGNLTDGTVIDLTSTTKGTNYTSSDLAICNFGAPDGRVFAGNDGSCTVTATNSGFSDDTSVIVRTFVPTALAFVSIPGFANNVDVNGGFAYVAAGSTGLQVVDVSDRSNPVIVMSEDTPGNANDVKVVGNTVYVADGSAGLRIIDISNPLDAGLVGAVDTPGDAQDVLIRGNLAYVADGSRGLQIIDVSNPASPSIIGSVDTPGTAFGVDVDTQIAVVADRGAGIQVVDISDPTNPAIVGNVDTGDAFDVVLNNDADFAFVAEGSNNSFTSVDIGDPTNPSILATTDRRLGGLLRDVALSERFAFGADIFFVNGVPIIDVSDPANPIPRAILDFRNFRDDNGTGIAVDSAHLYLTASRGSSTRLYIGQYLALEDTAGIPPIAIITSPTRSDVVIEGSSLAIAIEATDDIAVAAVDLMVNGEVVFTDTAPPYQFDLSVPVGETSLTIGATAVDLGGNIGSAPEVQITVIPDPLTTVVGRVVNLDGDPISGATVTTISSLSSTTGFDGTFSLPDVPTVLGSIQVDAAATIDGEDVRGKSAAVPPVREGVTDVGQIIMRQGLLPGVIAALPFDDGLNPTADIVGTHDGQLVGATFSTTDKAPISGNVSALVFDAFGKHVVLADQEPLSFGATSPYTISLWLKQTLFRSVYHVFGKRSGCSAFNYQLARDGRLVHFSTGSPIRLLLLGADFPLNEWTHVAVTYDGVSTVIMYVNGAEAVRRGDFVMSGENSSPLKLATSGTCSSSQTFPGLLDEFQVYDRALTPEEIAILTQIP